jgi:DNA polymerase III epsilon subunit-like protein
MEPKKNPKIDAGRNSSLYFSLGLICALSLSFVVLQTEFKETNFTISKNDPIEERDIFQPDFNKEINIIPEEVKKTEKITDFKLTSLAAHFEIPFLNAHDALSDCECLKQVCEKYTKENKIEFTQFLDTYRKPIGYFIARLKE